MAGSKNFLYHRLGDVLLYYYLCRARRSTRLDTAVGTCSLAIVHQDFFNQSYAEMNFVPKAQGYRRLEIELSIILSFTCCHGSASERFIIPENEVLRLRSLRRRARLASPAR